MMPEIKTILLVEDNEDDAFFFQRALAAASINVACSVVTDGEAAIHYLAGSYSYADRSRYPFPIFVFLDLKIPLHDGFEVLQWIRNEKHLTVPVVILSSSPEPRDKEAARKLGANCYLVKPPTKEMLLDCWKRFGSPAND